MAVFEFRGIQVATGKPVKGVRDADNAEGAARACCARDGILLTLATEESARKAQGRSASIDLVRVLPARRRRADVAMLTRQLATLVRAGIPLVESLGALIEQVEKEELEARPHRRPREGQRGHELRQGARAAPDDLPAALREHGRAGEASGTLEAVLERLADFMEAQARLKGKVLGGARLPGAHGDHRHRAGRRADGGGRAEGDERSSRAWTRRCPGTRSSSSSCRTSSPATGG